MNRDVCEHFNSLPCAKCEKPQATRRDDIINMAREAGLPYIYQTGEVANLGLVERFAALVAAAEREILADWMRQHGFSTGQAYTTGTLLDRLGAEMVENTDAAVLAEREACAKVVERRITGVMHNVDQETRDCAAAIRSRT